ncbi:phosphatase PAP2 family protein [Actinomadura roseirufa]|uniref:phosphatase PAP2 family protein n=1 Tax=Actinomadura roseirufa TaxID=2094049 RepID=UPI001041A229|nr:phosphatase PAP2 family protein [Actinomadura roseirufa]
MVSEVVGMRGRAWRSVRPLATEVTLLLALFAVYKWGRTVVESGPGEAMANARWLWGFERGWLPSEVSLQHWALGWDHTAFLANLYYVSVHFPGTALLLIWLYVRHRPSYARVRNELVVLTAAGLAVHMLFPLAPPRLAGVGAVDTMTTVGPSAYPAAADGVANQYAAMPSLHIGWALLVAIAVVRVSRSPWRWVVALHAPVTVFVVVVTANHYWTDGLVAAALLAGAMAAVAVAGRLRRPSAAGPRDTAAAVAVPPAPRPSPVPAAIAMAMAPAVPQAGTVTQAGAEEEPRVLVGAR